MAAVPGGTVQVERDGSSVRIASERMTSTELVVIAAIGLGLPLVLIAVFRSMLAVVAGALFAIVIAYFAIDHLRSRNSLVFDEQARTILVEPRHPRVHRRRARGPRCFSGTMSPRSAR